MMRQGRPELGSLLGLPVVEAVEFRDWSPGDRLVAKPSSSSPTGMLTDAETRFLKAVVDHPGQPSGTYTKLARMGPAQAVKARRRLVELGLLREHAVNTGARGRSSIIVEPLPGCREALGTREKA